MYMANTTTGRVKRNCTFCAACNYPFQGLAADGAKMALWMIYVNGYKIVNFVHDEIIVELPEDENLQDNVNYIQQLMIDAMSIAIPHVKIKAEPALMRRWYKEAEAVYDESGALQIWEPKKETA